jgi:hypothetical protein
MVGIWIVIIVIIGHSARQVIIGSQDDSLCGTTSDFPDIRASNCGGGRRAPARRDAAAGGTNFY